MATGEGRKGKGKGVKDGEGFPDFRRASKVKPLGGKKQPFQVKSTTFQTAYISTRCQLFEHHTLASYPRSVIHQCQLYYQTAIV